MKRLAYIAAGLVAGIVLATTGTALSAWLVNGHGQASASMARLSDLGVSVSKIEGAWPGDTVTVHATVKNGNARPLRVTTVTLTGLTADEKGCATGVKFEPKDGTVAAPGDTDMDVGTLTFPDNMPTRCSGTQIVGDLAIGTAYGS